MTPRRDRSGVCVSCDQQRQLKGRGLCETCWPYARKMGTLHQFPTKHERLHSAVRCTCFQPIEEPIPPWGVQCLKCKRPIPR